MVESNVIAYENFVPEIIKSLQSVEIKIKEQGFDLALYHLVKLRASQINQCGFCVKMHTREARADGETDKRLDRLIVWKHVDDFTDREKAAIKWTEALTILEDSTDYELLRNELKKHFSDHEISVLTTIINMINLWNRFQVSKH